MKCKKGEIYRKSYTRKSKLGKSVKVKENCIKATSSLGIKRTELNKAIIKSIKSRQLKASPKTKKVSRCTKGSIKRSAYERRSHNKRTRSGSIVTIPTVFVREKCIKKQGKPGPKGSPLIGPLLKGTLSSVGYSDVKHLNENERHIALEKAIKKYGSLSVLRKLNAVYVLNKNSNPSLSKIFLKDRNWVMAIR